MDDNEYIEIINSQFIVFKNVLAFEEDVISSHSEMLVNETIKYYHVFRPNEFHKY